MTEQPTSPSGERPALTQDERQPPPVGWWVPHPCPTVTALDPVAPAIAQSGTARANLLVTVTAPDQVNAVRWAGHIRDLVHAEFGASMGLHSFIELEPGGTPEPGPRHWLLQGTRDLDIPADKNGPIIENPQASGNDPVDNPADNKRTPTALRMRIARAIHRYDNHHALSGNDIPGKHQLGEADFVLAELRLELAALAAYENAINWHTTCLACARVLNSCYAETVRAEKAEAATTRVTGLHEQWVKAGAPPLGTSMARWWDRRLVELRDAIHGPAEQSARTTANNLAEETP